MSEGSHQRNRIDNRLDRETGGTSGEGGASASKEEADEISQHLEDDYPPGIVDRDISLPGLVGVGQDGVDLLFAKFYFHTCKG